MSSTDGGAIGSTKEGAILRKDCYAMLCLDGSDATEVRTKRSAGVHTTASRLDGADIDIEPAEAQR